MLVLVASFQDKLVKPVSEHQTILGLAAAWDDKGGSGDNLLKQSKLQSNHNHQNTNTKRFPFLSPTE